MSQSTRESILHAAEKLFVSKGFEGTSLRAITAEADVNLAAVNYHFGSKEQLLEAVLLARIAPVNEARLRRLDALEEEFGPSGLSVEQYLDAFIRPAAEFVRGLGRQETIGLLALVFTQHVRSSLLEEIFGEVAQRFGRLRMHLPHLSVEEFGWRFHYMIGSMIHAAAHDLEAKDARLNPHDDDSFVRMLVVWAAAGFRAEAALPVDQPRRPEEAAS